MKYLPLYLDLDGRKVLVVGNGPETAWKVEQLISVGAQVVLVAPDLPAELAEYFQTGQILLKRREFLETDLDDVWLVIGSSEDAETNRRIVRTAKQSRVFYNIVDVTHLCAFIYPAIVQQGSIQVAISTSGKSPALAQRLKNLLGEVIGPEYGALNDLLGRVRNRVLEQVPERRKRAELFQELVNAGLLELLRDGEVSGAERRAEDLINSSLSMKA